MCLKELAFSFGKAGWRCTQAGAEGHLSLSSVSILTVSYSIYHVFGFAQTCPILGNPIVNTEATSLKLALLIVASQYLFP